MGPTECEESGVMFCLKNVIWKVCSLMLPVQFHLILLLSHIFLGIRRLSRQLNGILLKILSSPPQEQMIKLLYGTWQLSKMTKRRVWMKLRERYHHSCYSCIRVKRILRSCIGISKFQEQSLPPHLMALIFSKRYPFEFDIKNKIY